MPWMDMIWKKQHKRIDHINRNANTQWHQQHQLMDRQTGGAQAHCVVQFKFSNVIVSKLFSAVVANVYSGTYKTTYTQRNSLLATNNF